MQELVGRLTAVDPQATETLKVIAYFDALVHGHASPGVLLRGAAILGGCAAGFTADGVTLRVDSSGAPSAASTAHWPSRRIGDQGIAWIEREGSAHANDDMILERLILALGIALDRRSPAAESRRALTRMLDAAAPVDARLSAARQLKLAIHSKYRVVAYPADTEIGVESVVVSSQVGAVRLAVHDADVEPRDARAGIGLAAFPPELHESSASAVIALRLTSPSTPIVAADDLGSLLMLAEVADRAEHSAHYATADLTALEQVLRSQPNAAETLDAMIAHTSLRSVASQLGLHHSTMQARALAYSRLFGFDVTSGGGRTRLAVAVALHRLTTTRFE